MTCDGKSIDQLKFCTRNGSGPIERPKHSDAEIRPTGHRPLHRGSLFPGWAGQQSSPHREFYQPVIVSCHHPLLLNARPATDACQMTGRDRDSDSEKCASDRCHRVSHTGCLGDPGHRLPSMATASVPESFPLSKRGGRGAAGEATVARGSKEQSPA